MSLCSDFSILRLQFNRPAGTSRGVLTHKTSWIIRVWQSDSPEKIGIGECSIIPGLSPDYQDNASYEKKLLEVCQNIKEFSKNSTSLTTFPSIRFGLEMALLDLKMGGNQIWFPSPFTRSAQDIPINGLIWMGDEAFMHEQIESKLDEGFSCIKMKVGAINFNQELNLLASIRKRYDASKITLRVDANGAFSPCEVNVKLAQLAALDIHSIEQPIRAGQLIEMHDLCRSTPLPIALDEELIGVTTREDKRALLAYVMPQYIILKPSLLGGFSATKEWITIAETLHIPWWITSALESNLGLNAIAQFTATHDIELPQGLGTGGLYTTNIDAPLVIENGRLKYIS